MQWWIQGGTRGARLPPYCQTKLGPEGRKKFCKTGLPVISGS